MILEDMDPMALACLFNICASTKSAAVGLCLMHGLIGIEEAVALARTEEDF
jgi:chaperone required for assembly of F1-ATPase